MRNHFHSYWEEDRNVEDLLESRHFYEMLQDYRHEAVDASKAFEAVQEMLRKEFNYQRHAARAEALREAAEASYEHTMIGFFREELRAMAEREGK